MSKPKQKMNSKERFVVQVCNDAANILDNPFDRIALGCTLIDEAAECLGWSIEEIFEKVVKPAFNEYHIEQDPEQADVILNLQEMQKGET